MVYLCTLFGEFMELEVLGTIVGLAYLWLEYKASIYLWIASIIMPAIYIFVYYEAGLYADFGINIYYLGATIYGWWVWKYGHNTKEVKEFLRSIRHEQQEILHLQEMIDAAELELLPQAIRILYARQP